MASESHRAAAEVKVVSDSGLHNLLGKPSDSLSTPTSEAFSKPDYSGCLLSQKADQII